MKTRRDIVPKSSPLVATLLLICLAFVAPLAGASFHGQLIGGTVTLLSSEIGADGSGEVAWDCVTIEPDGPHVYPTECGGPLWPLVDLVVSTAQAGCDWVFHNPLVPGECESELVRRYVVIH